jgi:putative PIN family toxin of toxin-antitoxin system
MKVFLDTNVIASATATRGLCADVLRTVIEFHDLVVSDHLVGEVRRILKDKFAASPDLIADVVWLLRQETIASEAQPLRNVPLSDPADVAIVSSALNGAADILVTGDKEVLALRRVGSLEILTPRQFWDKERGQQRGFSGSAAGAQARRRRPADPRPIGHGDSHMKPNPRDQEAQNEPCALFWCLILCFAFTLSPVELQCTRPARRRK